MTKALLRLGRTLERGDSRSTEEELTTGDFETVHKDVLKEGGEGRDEHGGTCGEARVMSMGGRAVRRA